MRIKNLLMLGAFLAMSGGAMAQTELTAGKVKVVPGFTGELTLNLTTPVEVGGWQMNLVLPEGVSLESEDGQLVIGSSSSAATVFNDVVLTRGKDNHQVIGGIDSEGQTLVVCVPTAKEAKISGTSGELCKISLTADGSFTGTKECQIKGFIAADPTGTTTYEAAAVTFNIVQLKCDLSGEGTVDVTDLSKVIDYIWTENLAGDVNGDGEVNITDLSLVIDEIFM